MGGSGPPFHTTPWIWLNQSLHCGNATSRTHTHTIFTRVKIGARGKLRKKLNFVATHTRPMGAKKGFYLIISSPPDY